MRLLAYALLFVTLWSCSPDHHAGVITETESGKKISGIVLDSLGVAVPGARVYLLDTNHLANRDIAPVVVITDGTGAFQLDSIPVGTYNLIQEDSLHNSIAQQRITIADDSTQNYYADTSRLALGATVIIPLDLFSLDWGDTLCIWGSLTCSIVDSIDLQKGQITWNNLPAKIIPSLAKMTQGNSSIETITVSWNLQAGQTNIAIAKTLQSPVAKIQFTLPDSQALALGNISAIPFPIWLSSSIVSPSLTNSEGQRIRLDKTFTAGDSTLYWAVAADFDFTKGATISFLVFDSTTQEINPPVIPMRKALHMDDLVDSSGILGKAMTFDTTSTYYSITPFTTFVDSNSLGMSLWIKMDGNIQTGTYTRIFTSSLNNSGITLQQRADRTSMDLRIDTKNGDYNALFGQAQILDGAWHQYSFTIHNGHVCVLMPSAI